MGLIKGILKVGASAVLTATGVAAGAGKLFFEIAGGNELAAGLAELLGKGKDASFNAIRSMWDNGENSKVFDTIDSKLQDTDTNVSEATRRKMAETAKNAADAVKIMAEEAEMVGDTEKCERLMKKYDSYMDQYYKYS